MCEKTASNKCFEGTVEQYSHQSDVLNCKMSFTVFRPASKDSSAKLPVLFFLSGLTCTDQNFITKAGAQREASKHGIVLVCPDTSPRGAGVEGEDDKYDLGTGAGFYLDATEPKWSKHYNMYSYITKELPELVHKTFGTDPQKMSIMGHSMGGMGALAIALKNPGVYQSVSVFSPIANPTAVEWGQKAFTVYLGDDKESWKAYDPCELVKKYSGPPMDILIDQGLDDEFYVGNALRPESFTNVCQEEGIQCALRLHDGYDHGYYFISTFVSDHIVHHARYLCE
ncbi:S-formylglutathione hydrolase [Sphaeroforma arctica JP610]|uniref:S-formylglutathione hydrolase n=1 Tax=Sphaeroforma arctica JP610 TaxID=667725 RepID=A0A0L0FIW1_9EUKA|nr:S-formylglutathione hydrolase [Sphaeroforma arctica JP610]KNC76714.1 S-formylglutathione hydrolase [Sphaeroforma arctica JP610]|eukprot:XP_014150616.1 S-formylglutathione hydrolase [Sphaeroforma arctica JP610]